MASPAPQPPAPQPPGKPAPPPAGCPPRDPKTNNPKPAEEGALFRALVDVGVDATLAYTVEKRMHAMTSETAAAQIRPVRAELGEMRENMVTKADLANLETRMIRWMFGALMAQAVLIVALVVGFVSLLR